MKTINPKPLEKLGSAAESGLTTLKLILGGAVFTATMGLVLFGGMLYTILAGFAAAAGVVHLFNGPDSLAWLLGIIFAILALQPGTHILFFIAAFLGATYAWDWPGLLAFIIFLPGLFFIPLLILIATVLGLTGLVKILKRTR